MRKSIRVAAAILSLFPPLTLPAAAQSFAADLTVVEDNMNGLLSAGAPQAYGVTVRSNGITELYLKGEPFNGSPTRFFTLYKYPDNPLHGPSIATGKAPAVVLVHGGGGTAYEVWVEKWNDAGFAAISIAVEGQTDNPGTDGTRWQQHAYPGPARNGIYGDSDEPVEDQWMFHAVSAVIRAHNYLRSQSDIDASHIGVSGISWGGVISATSMGYDNRFDFAVPIYGSGFLDEMPNQYFRALKDNGQYRYVWEPGNKLANFTRPSLWLTGRDDAHFSLAAQAASYREVTGVYVVSIKPDMAHNHVAGWTQPEPYEFATRVVLENRSWVRPLISDYVNNFRAMARFKFLIPAGAATDDPGYRITGAKIYYTTKKCHTGFVPWEAADTTELYLVAGSTDIYQANFDNLPADAELWFINLTVDIEPDMEDGIPTDDVVVSSAVFEMP